MKSTINRVKPFEEKEIVITKLFGDQNTVAQHEKRLKEIFKNDTDQQIVQKVNNIILRENAINNVMETILPYFEFTINSQDEEKVKSDLANTFKGMQPVILDSVAEKVIKKKLMFDLIAKEQNIEVSKEEIDESLNKFYKDTNESIRKYYDNKDEYEKIRLTMLEDKILKYLFSVFKINFKLEKPQQKSEEVKNIEKVADDKTNNEQKEIENK
jgi:FKBP-type peptidyl-prolyl cis-trans isomerase (trigger factor)